MPKTVEFIDFRPASSAKNETAIVFVHGFTGDVAKTWRRIPEFLQADPRLNEWDLLGFGYQGHLRFDRICPSGGIFKRRDLNEPTPATASANINRPPRADVSSPRSGQSTLAYFSF